MKIRKEYPLPNIIFILSLSLICIFYFVYLHYLIPNKFYIDSNTIMNGIINPSSVDNSYRNVAVLYRFLGINSNSPKVYIYLIAWIIFQLFLLFVLRMNKNKEFSIIQLIFISCFTFMYGIYFDTLSKDLVLFLFLLIFINFYMYNHNFNYLILFIGLYAIFFRNYWVILFFFSIFIYFIKKQRIINIMLYIILLYIFIIIIHDYFSGEFITSFRVFVDAPKIGTINANSIIQNIFPNINIINDVSNYLYVLITLIFPIQGFGSFNVIIYYLWIIILIMLIIKYKNYINIKFLLLLFAYINMQALFEPDIGSAFRHQLALFPLIYYLLNDINFERKSKI